MRNSWYKKGLIVGIIVLFIFSSVVPVVFASHIKVLDTIEKQSTISRGNTLYVGGSGEGNYTKIQYAIDNASDGDTVFVYNDSSPYYEDGIDVSKLINLIGEDKETTIIEGSGYEKVVIISADNVVISGFTIQKSGFGNNILPWTKAGIYNQGADNTSIYDNILRNNRGEGICIRGSKYCVVENNLIIENGFRGLLILDSLDTLIKHNTIRNNSKNGILGVTSNRINVYENNIMFNDEHGTEFISTYDALIKRNNFYKNKGDTKYTFYGSTNGMEDEDYYREYLKEKSKGALLRFDANYWTKGRKTEYRLYQGYIIIEGPFWQTRTYPYYKYDMNPANKPYDIPGWDIEDVVDYPYNEQVSQANNQNVQNTQQQTTQQTTSQKTTIQQTIIGNFLNRLIRR